MRPATYDGWSRLTSISYAKAGASLGNLTYGYEALGRRTSMGGSLARTGLPVALTYDANGILTSDGAKTYAWNARDQMVSMTGASFAYDAAGRRKSKMVGGSTTSYFFDGANPVQEQGAVSADTLGGLAMDEIYQRTDVAGAKSLQTDGLGSVLGLMDAGGTALTQYTYEPFGSATAAGVGSSNPFGFTGREEDGTGLMYYRARYYSPGMQRFVSEDPLGFGGGDVNLYGYVGNGPTNAVDPTGLSTLLNHGWDIGQEAALGFALGKIIGGITSLFWSCRSSYRELGGNALGSMLASMVSGALIPVLMYYLYGSLDNQPIGEVMWFATLLGGIANWAEYLLSTAIAGKTVSPVKALFAVGSGMGGGFFGAIGAALYSPTPAKAVFVGSFIGAFIDNIDPELWGQGLPE